MMKGMVFAIPFKKAVLEVEVKLSEVEELFGLTVPEEANDVSKVNAVQQMLSEFYGSPVENVSLKRTF